MALAQWLDELAALTAQNLPCLEVSETYRVLGLLGQGAFGHVVLALHQQRGTPLALKFVAKRAGGLEAFLSEYCIALSLAAHPCVAGALGIAFQTPRHYVFAQEFALARDLFSILQPEVGAPEVRVRRCALQLASALDFMGAKGLVHGDIKPDNVLLLDPECRRVKLSDFGQSRPQGRPVERPPAPLPYAAPELCRLPPGRQLPAQPSLDAWALGVLLFVALTGYFPWITAADRHYQVFERWLRDPAGRRPCPPHWHRFSPLACSLLRGLLAPEPAHRSPPRAVLPAVRRPWLQPAPAATPKVTLVASDATLVASGAARARAPEVAPVVAPTMASDATLVASGAARARAPEVAPVVAPDVTMVAPAVAPMVASDVTLVAPEGVPAVAPAEPGPLAEAGGGP
ncbi:serine/threonine-protein kinase SBK2-like [Dromaius novaehollandiae]|uniref:serine/threonine-protein kinase SBK2-like n=1 Tax=Dromaius novaehollandiae TaxID=8790 RepID=UPI003120168D